jgi:hypothetical protein
MHGAISIALAKDDKKYGRNHEVMMTKCVQCHLAGLKEFEM